MSTEPTTEFEEPSGSTDQPRRFRIVPCTPPNPPPPPPGFTPHPRTPPMTPQMEVIPSTPQEVPDIPPHNYSPITAASGAFGLDEEVEDNNICIVNFVVYGPAPFVPSSDVVEPPAADPAAIAPMTGLGSAPIAHPVVIDIASANASTPPVIAVDVNPASSAAAAEAPPSDAAIDPNPAGVYVTEFSKMFTSNKVDVTLLAACT